MLLDSLAYWPAAQFIFIRYSLENQPQREFIAHIVAVNESPITVAARY
jgi:hypothetical protein